MYVGPACRAKGGNRPGNRPHTGDAGPRKSIALGPGWPVPRLKLGEEPGRWMGTVAGSTRPAASDP